MISIFIWFWGVLCINFDNKWGLDFPPWVKDSNILIWSRYSIWFEFTDFWIQRRWHWIGFVYWLECQFGAIPYQFVQFPSLLWEGSSKVSAWVFLSFLSSFCLVEENVNDKVITVSFIWFVDPYHHLVRFRCQGSKWNLIEPSVWYALRMITRRVHFVGLDWRLRTRWVESSNLHQLRQGRPSQGVHVPMGT